MPSTIDPRPEDYPAFSSRAPIEIQEDGEDFDSSNVHSLLYDFGAFAPEGVDEEARQMLIARYKRDGADAVYEYPDFPASEWAGLASASSKGRYINLNVVGVYAFNRLRLSQWPDGTRSVRNPMARRFLTQGMTTDAGASHPHL